MLFKGNRQRVPVKGPGVRSMVAFCRVIVGCILRSLELSGGKEIKVVHETCIVLGDPVCTYAVTWSGK